MKTTGTLDAQGWLNFTEGRRGAVDTDYPALKEITRRVYLDQASAVAAMSGNSVAFRVYDRSEFGGGFGIGVLAEYFVIERAKKSQPYRMTERSALASCQADAIDKLGDDYTGLKRTVSSDEWRRIQVNQHLKALGIKARK